MDQQASVLRCAGSHAAFPGGGQCVGSGGSRQWRLSASGRVEYRTAPQRRERTKRGAESRALIQGWRVAAVPDEVNGKRNDTRLSSIAKRQPVGWQLPSFDKDYAPPACQVAKLPDDTLVMNELPPLMEIYYPVFDAKTVSGNVTHPAEPPTAAHPHRGEWRRQVPCSFQPRDGGTMPAGRER